MDAAYEFLTETFGDSSVFMLALLVFLATTTLTFGVMVAMRTRGAVKRRAAGISHDIEDRAGEGNSVEGDATVLPCSSWIINGSKPHPPSETPTLPSQRPSWSVSPWRPMPSPANAS